VSGEVRRNDVYTVSSSIDGRISELLVEEGVTVTSGDELIAVDGRTSVAVDGAVPFYRTLTVGSEGPDVLQLEEILVAAGQDIEQPDTLFTEETRDALAAWQIARGYASSAAETDETVTLTLGPNNAGYTIGRANAAAFVIVPSIPSGRGQGLPIEDTRPLISVSVTRSTVEEGGVVRVRFESDQDLEEDITIELAVSGTATEGVDFRRISRTVEMRENTDTASIEIETFEDDILEGDEELTVSIISSFFGAYRVDGSSRVDITLTDATDSDGERAVNVTTAIVEAEEGTVATFTLRTSFRSDRDLQIEVEFGGTAVPDDDFLVPTPDQLVIRAGTMSTDVTIRLRDDGVEDGEKTLSMKVLPKETDDPLTTYAVGVPEEVMITITSPGRPELTVVGGGRISEGGAGSFRIVADEPVPADTSINYQISGTATPGIDYRVVSGTVVMKAGTSSVSVTIDTLDDDVVFHPSDMIVASWPVRVGPVPVEVGDLVARGTPLFELVEPNFTIALTVGAAERSELVVGQRVSVDLTIGNQILDGSIASLDESATLGPNGEQIFEGEVAVESDYEAIDGAKVSVDVVLAEVENVLAVPVAAVLRTADGDVVRVVNDAGTITRIPVSIGLVDREWVEVTEGLTGDELVVVDIETEGRVASP
jgi:hypothetical protein